MQSNPRILFNRLAHTKTLLISGHKLIEVTKPFEFAQPYLPPLVSLVDIFAFFDNVSFLFSPFGMISTQIHGYSILTEADHKMTFDNLK